MLDSMDVMLFAFVLPEVMRDFHLSGPRIGAIMSATLIAAAVGGLGFGRLADRMGRKRALTGSILIYSVATAACGLTHTAVALAACRIVLGLGMGGEWASGATLVAETWPAQHRAKALAFVQSFWAIGYALAAAIVALVMPRFRVASGVLCGGVSGGADALAAAACAGAGGLAAAAARRRFRRRCCSGSRWGEGRWSARR